MFPWHLLLLQYCIFAFHLSNGTNLPFLPPSPSLSILHTLKKSKQKVNKKLCKIPAVYFWPTFPEATGIIIYVLCGT